MFNLVNHTEDDGRILVLYGLVYFVQTEGVEVAALILGLTNAALNLSDFQSCHSLFLSFICSTSLII
jgi:hypothetical protein